MASDDDRGESSANRRTVLKGIGAGALGTISATGLGAAASSNDIWVVASDDFGASWQIANRMRDYVEEIYYDSSWNVHLDSDFDTSGAPTDDDGSYTKNCGNGEYGLWDWWNDNGGYVDHPDDCQLLMVPNGMYNGGCATGKSAVSCVARSLWDVAKPNSGENSYLIGDGSNDTAYGEKANSIARCLHEMGHTFGAGHADGHIWVTDGVTRHSPLMLGDGQSNTCGYDVNYCGSCRERFLEGYANCETSGFPHPVLDYSESFMEDYI